MKRILIVLTLMSIYTGTIRAMDADQKGEAVACIMGTPGKRLVIGKNAKVTVYAQDRSVASIQGGEVARGAQLINIASGGGQALISACDVAIGACIINSAEGGDEEEPKIIYGSGKTATKIIPLPMLTSIHTMGLGRLVIHNGSNTLHISADDNILQYCNPIFNEDQLVLSDKAHHNLSPVTPITYHVMLTAQRRALLASIIAQSTVSIKAPIGSSKLILEHSGNDQFICEAWLKLQELIIKQNGTGKMLLSNSNIAKQLILTHTNAGSVTISGSVPQALFTLTGIGAVHANRLAIDTLLLNHAGEGLLECFVKQAFNGMMNGKGSVKNYGRSNDQSFNCLGSGKYEKMAKSQ